MTPGHIELFKAEVFAITVHTVETAFYVRFMGVSFFEIG